jgi:cytochrome c553
MPATTYRTLLFVFLFSFCSALASNDDATESDVSASNVELVDALVGDSEAGEIRYNQTCKNCHGTAGKGVASYPKVSGKEISYTTKMLETYRDGIKVGPNSSLMIMMAKPLTDEEIANLAAYLKEADTK